MVLPGITRQFIVNYQKEIGIDVSFCYVTSSDLETFDEIFLTNALKGVILVDQVAGYSHVSSKEVSNNKLVKQVYLGKDFSV